MGTKKNENKVEEASKFIKILVGVVLVLVIIYGFTVLVANKNKKAKTNDNNTTEEANIDYNKILIGSMFTINSKDYYVLIYKKSSVAASIMESAMSTYSAKDGAIDIYYADLDDGFNLPYYSKDESNKNATKLDEIKVKDYTLIRFKNNKITEYYETITEINDKLTK